MKPGVPSATAPFRPTEAATKGLAAPAKGSTAAGTALTTTTTNETTTDPELLQQQLQLIQLCFGEHEFGIVLDGDDAVGGGPTAASQTSGPKGLGQTDDEQDDFDPFEFIEGKTGHGVQLQTLCRDLNVFIEYVQGKITQHVNTDVHTAFVNVSGHLVGMQEELQYVQRPLSSTIKKVTVACQQLSEVSDTIQTKVQHASEVELERVFDTSFLKALLLYERIADTMDALAPELATLDAAAAAAAPSSPHEGSPSSPSPFSLAAGQGAGGSPSGAATTAEPQGISTQLLDRLEAVAMSARQLRTTESFLPVLPHREKERHELAEYVQSSSKALQDVLRQVFCVLCNQLIRHRASDQASTRAHLRDVVSMYERAGEMTEFVAMFREAVLRPFLESVLSWKAATQARQNVEETVRLLRHVEAELAEKIVPLFPMLRECFHDELFPASSILWPTLCEVLVKKLVSLYEVGIPEAFQRKYNAAYRLLALTESCCTSLAELEVLRQSPDVALWNHKWNTDVYVAMRVAEVEKKMNAALEPMHAKRPLSEVAPPPAEGQAGGPPKGFTLPVFNVLQEQLEWLFSPGVFIRVCTPKFMRQVVTSCQSVVKAAFQYCTEVQNGDVAPSATPSVGDSQEWLALLVGFIADVRSLSTFVCGPLRQCVEGAVGADMMRVLATQSTKADTTSISDVLTFVKESVCNGYVDAAQRMMTGKVVEECSAALQNIRSVRSAYSHTKKVLRGETSWYVQGVIEPIQRFVADSRLCGFADDVLSELVRGIVSDVASQFCTVARETLIAAKRTEESWEKLRRRKESAGSGGGVGGPSGAGGGGGGGGAGVGGGDAVASPTTPTSTPALAGSVRVTPETATDRDKMILQLYTDITSIVNAVASLGLGLPVAELFGSAFSLLRRAEWINGADIPEPPDIDENES